MFQELSFMTRGAITAALGLGGTFLVLVLIYLAIKLINKLGRKQ